jgi:hypothetical protein
MGIKYIADFRDLWDNRAIDPSFPFNRKTQLQYKLIQYYWSKWLSQASFFTTISEEWVHKINYLTPTPGYVVMHGYDTDIENLFDRSETNESFTCLYSGKLYNNQDIVGFLRGLKKFIDNNDSPKIKVIFLGSIRQRKPIHSRYFDELEQTIKAMIPKEYYEIVPRLPRQQFLTYFASANVYIMLSYKNMEGTHSGKLFEYLGSKKPILLYPSDNSVIAEALTATKLGVVSNNEFELAQNLNHLYKKWKSGDKTKCDKKELAKWSRDYQTFRMSELIKSALSEYQNNSREN